MSKFLYALSQYFCLILKSGLNRAPFILMHCLVPGSYFIRNACGVQGLKQALNTSIYLCDETKRRQERTGTCTR